MRVIKISFLMLFCLLAIVVVPSMAQMSANPPQVAEKIRAMGNMLTPAVIQGTFKLYGPLLAGAPKEGVSVVQDVEYGPADRNRLDIYKSKTKPISPAPILVFVHGGGFVRGDKKGAANIGAYFARHGVLAITLNYRFAPKTRGLPVPRISPKPSSGYGKMVQNTVVISIGFFLWALLLGPRMFRPMSFLRTSRLKAVMALWGQFCFQAPPTIRVG